MSKIPFLCNCFQFMSSKMKSKGFKFINWKKSSKRHFIFSHKCPISCHKISTVGHTHTRTKAHTHTHSLFLLSFSLHTYTHLLTLSLSRFLLSFSLHTHKQMHTHTRSLFLFSRIFDESFCVRSQFGSWRDGGVIPRRNGFESNALEHWFVGALTPVLMTF